MKTMFARVETVMGPRTMVSSVWNDAEAAPLASGLASGGAMVVLRPATGGRYTVAELVAKRDKALVRETRALYLVSDIKERENLRSVQ